MASKEKKTTKAKAPKVRMIKAEVLQTKVRKAEQDIICFNAKETEDQFTQFQGVDGIIHPPMQPKWLKLVTTHNNTLSQAIAAMEINIDGSGFVIESDDDKAAEGANKAKIEAIEAFFKEVAPGISFLNVRRKLRRDMEATGYGFMEIIRNMKEEVVALKWVDVSTIRLIRLGAPVKVKKELIRQGTKLEIEMWVRERAFVQILANQKIFFKEYGATQEINKKTGFWATDENKVDFNTKGSELAYFTIDEDINTPYGVPRWINNMPSALGSRKAEELNLDFFDSGGVPPAILTIMGGRMVGDYKKQLENFLSGKNSSTRIAVLEAQTSDGNIDSNAGKLKIDVQRFGSEKQNDSMFENYDEKSSERVRSSFRLPPLFIGKIRDFNLATAKTSYQVAESQVFKPEREEFDDFMTRFIVRELDGEGIRMRSLPITLTDTELQMKGLTLAEKSNLINKEQTTDVLNEITNLGLTFNKEVQEEADAKEVAVQEEAKANREANAKANPPGGKPPFPPKAKDDDSKVYTIFKDEQELTDLFTLATDLAEVMTGSRDKDFTDTMKKEIHDKYFSLAKRDQEFVQDLISMKVFDSTDLDNQGARELVHGCLHTE